jgi:DNA-binding winged helix-turn-helix (wHTH) protein
MKAVWPNSFVEDVNLAHNISILRKVLGQGAPEQSYIQTMPRRGYRFTAVEAELRIVLRDGNYLRWARET